jgi:hypothetical protein
MNILKNLGKRKIFQHLINMILFGKYTCNIHAE